MNKKTQMEASRQIKNPTKYEIKLKYRKTLSRINLILLPLILISMIALVALSSSYAHTESEATRIATMVTLIINFILVLAWLMIFLSIIKKMNKELNNK